MDRIGVVRTTTHRSLMCGGNELDRMGGKGGGGRERTHLNSLPRKPPERIEVAPVTFCLVFRVQGGQGEVSGAPMLPKETAFFRR